MIRSVTLTYTGENIARTVNVQGAFAVTVVGLNSISGDVTCQIYAMYNAFDAAIGQHQMVAPIVVAGGTSRSWTFSHGTSGSNVLFVPDVLELRLAAAKAAWRWIVHIVYDD